MSRVKFFIYNEEAKIEKKNHSWLHTKSQVCDESKHMTGLGCSFAQWQSV